MDNKQGEFTKIGEEKYQEQMQKVFPMVFKTGDILEIRGSRFRVEKILRNKLILKLLPAIKIETDD